MPAFAQSLPTLLPASSTSSADAARQRLRDGFALSQDDLFALNVAAEFDMGLTPTRVPHMGSLAVLEDLNEKRRVLEVAKVVEQVTKTGLNPRYVTIPYEQPPTKKESVSTARVNPR